ncbi:hypothetical protein AQUCO_01300473v1, partial [Aquilegia coerulea]
MSQLLINVLKFRSAIVAKDSIIQSYTRSFNAFAARLSPDEVKKLANAENVLSVYPNRYYKLHTTKSWDFLGFPQTVPRNAKSESDIVIGLLDTGISPDLDSFNDKGFGPPPAKWKGTCNHYANFSGCNNKIVGARYFRFDNKADPMDILSPMDVHGHGTHTASTAAGNVVANANLYGLAQGTARGAVPSARIAMYKVCWESTGCSDIDILGGFEAAIDDGVDVISISAGGEPGHDFYGNDSIAIGSFHAMKRGIITVASAGNGGPSYGSVKNHAPWILTVAASSIGRQFTSKVTLGNGNNLTGIGINTFAPTQKQYPLVNGSDASNNSTNMHHYRYCDVDTLVPTKVKGKLVYCEFMKNTETEIQKVGAVGTIIQTDDLPDVARIYGVPATSVNKTIGKGIIKEYMSSTRAPSAVIYGSVEVKVPAPFVASFSSRGPNPGTTNILKPDIAAPGVNILAAYTPLKPLTELKGDTRHSKFTIMSGTSMACPHVAGTAAYIKSFHPEWSPATIKSAIITTATPMTPNSKDSDFDSEFAYGAGQINPTKAVNPGLIYDMDSSNYTQFLCQEGYNETYLRILVQSKSVNCSASPVGQGLNTINYPSMQLSVKENQTTVGNFQRTVTNVGPARSIYNCTIKAPQGVEMTVNPVTLSFTQMFQTRNFTVGVKVEAMGKIQTTLSGSLLWTSGEYV